jgi:uncharacterized protein
MVFLAGPRQVGKTTVAQQLLEGEIDSYLNWDVPDGRERILKRDYPITELIVFDELHKFKTWKSYLKGLYDDPRRKMKILVTGSARLDLYRKGGDSLQGRYHLLRLHPLSVKELNITNATQMEELLERGGFPEPFLSQSNVEAKRWSREYRSRVIREEIRDLEQIEDLGKLELLMLRLPELVGSPLSINAIREDLNVAHKTIERWIEALERLYVSYRIAPLASSQIKAVKKSQKCYLYNWSIVEDPEARFENFVAGHLLKWAHYQQDVFGKDIEIYYVRDSTGREVDFAICDKRKVISIIECKLSETKIDPTLKYFSTRFPKAAAIQVVQNLAHDKERIVDGIQLRSGLKFLQELI